MSKGYDRVAFTQHVRNAQARYGSRGLVDEPDGQPASLRTSGAGHLGRVRRARATRQRIMLPECPYVPEVGASRQGREDGLDRGCARFLVAAEQQGDVFADALPVGVPYPDQVCRGPDPEDAQFVPGLLLIPGLFGYAQVEQRL